ncbi:2Fe-2S iron-sulfur cluster-binding protein [Salinibacillus xinjiangensis]|uniref:2Fe-2S iron-sulfur cluster binding domain-containing protein n=1 Tax=Salinibacillus xinjiangensis TaxID=1229268 RepID=A0A6G1X587_9BACI|nr:2Fe-2S iron-sulfur cluster-binding protein [Salinibacillus xinjiangensis]MRG86040.1 2Fe-2S iron-sulfur cluster binding domain-containing protein [Salinibacillus xinjiangensis]
MAQLQVKIQRTETNTKTYDVTHSPDMTVLDVLEEIYHHHDETIAYRFSCRTGLCATCMMMINGKPSLSCMTIAEPNDEGYLFVSPLPKGKTIKDLVKVPAN